MPTHACACAHTHTHTHIYIYIYILRIVYISSSTLLNYQYTHNDTTIQRCQV